MIILTILAYVLLAILYLLCLAGACLAIFSVWTLARSWNLAMSNPNPNGYNGGCSMEYHESPPQFHFKD